MGARLCISIFKLLLCVSMQLAKLLLKKKKKDQKKLFNKKSRSYYENSLCKSVRKMVLHAAALEARRSITRQSR